ncbi:o-succinylbenzoate synthase [Coraliomargarita sp. W4R53]
MSRQITVKPYQRAFRRPLRTARSEWAIREGFLLRVEQDGRIGYGEVAPIPEFGTETVAEAAAFLKELVHQPTLQLSSDFPCCAFALSAALQQPAAYARDYAVSALLPAGDAGLQRAVVQMGAGYRSMKWKIGVEPIAQEISLARSLLESLSVGRSVRFDANASLTSSELEQWLELLARFPDQVDYMEQPLACGEEAVMAQYMQDSGVPIALDESLNGDNGQSWLEPAGWAGPLVVKAPLMGDVASLASRLAGVADQVVFSSVFETRIGLENSLRLADGLPQVSRPIGFDTFSAFDDDLQPMKPSPQIRVVERECYNPELIWNLI